MCPHPGCPHAPVRFANTHLQNPEDGVTQFLIRLHSRHLRGCRAGGGLSVPGWHVKEWFLGVCVYGTAQPLTAWTPAA